MDPGVHAEHENGFGHGRAVREAVLPRLPGCP